MLELCGLRGLLEQGLTFSDLFVTQRAAGSNIGPFTLTNPQEVTGEPNSQHREKQKKNNNSHSELGGTAADVLVTCPVG